MAVEETTTRISDDNNTSDTLRKIVAAIVGLIVIILIVLLAKWLGDRIRERFVSTPPTVQTIPPEEITESTPSGDLTFDPRTGTYRASTASAIPATGPNDVAYIIMATLIIGGTSALAISRKITI